MENNTGQPINQNVPTAEVPAATIQVTNVDTNVVQNVSGTIFEPIKQKESYKKLVITAGISGALTYIAYVIGIAIGGGLASIVTGPALGIIAGTLCLWRLSKVPLYRAAMVAIVSVFIHYASVPFGLPQDNRIDLFIVPFLVMIAVVLVCAIGLTFFSRKKRFLDVVAVAIVLVVTAPISRVVRTSQTTSKFNEEVSSISFQLYKPTYAPQRYSVSITRPYIADDFMASASHYVIRYSQERGLGYTMYQYATPDFYEPPEDCGRGEPEFTDIKHLPQDCTKIGVSKNGCDVYASKPKLTNQSATLCELKGTLVTLFSSPLELTDEEIIKTFDGLEKSDGQTLLKIGPN